MTIKYSLLPAQQQAVHIEDPRVDLDVCVYQGGYGSGKTFIGSFLGIELCRKYPGIRGLAVAKTYPLLRDTTLETYFEHFENLGFEEGEDFIWRATESKIIFPQYKGSEILFRHLEKPWKLKSLNLGWIHVEEMSEIEESAFLMLLSRLRQSGVSRYRLFGTTNPQSNKGWIHQYFVEKNQGIQVQEVDGQETVIHYRRVIAPSTQNIHLSASYLLNMQNQYDPDYYRINVLGEDGDYTAGLVVKNWSIANEDDIPYKPELRIYLSCDFNVDPMCWALAHRVNGEYHFFDEICIENTNIITCAQEFARRYGEHKAGIIITGDAAGNSRSDTTEEANKTRYDVLLKALSDLGVTNVALDVNKRNPRVEARIEVFNGMVCNQQGVRRIKADRTRCKQGLHIMKNLKYIPGTGAVWQPTPNQIAMDNKMKFLRDDMFDAMSYLIWKYDPKIETPQKPKPKVKTVQYGGK